MVEDPANLGCTALRRFSLTTPGPLAEAALTHHVVPTSSARSLSAMQIQRPGIATPAAARAILNTETNE